MAVHNTYTEEQVRQIKEEKLIQAEFLDRYGSKIAGWFAIAVLVAISFAQYGPERVIGFGVGWAGLITLVIAPYMLPAIVAYYRGHKNAMAITVLNIFLGWTLLGWIGALVWACTSNVKQ